ncbi:MAG TPA: hypothetical protein PKA28_19545 [Methylomusa anaerophila]|nr:hypothetical protein [Methylomusa anaerophila]HML90630.1 hypothetical protein [Methylomusa anaerophila]
MQEVVHRVKGLHAAALCLNMLPFAADTMPDRSIKAFISGVTSA